MVALFFVLLLLCFFVCCASKHQLQLPQKFKEPSMQVTKNLPAYEYNALHDFYLQLNGPNWHWFNVSGTTHWNFSAINPNPCFQKWQGLSCNCLLNPTYCYVDEINLPLHNLSGIFPTVVGTFKYLTSLALLKNNITGTLPSTVVANLTNLQHLDLRNNLMYGEIPSNVNKMASLEMLALAENFFEGSLPPFLYKLTKLRLLILQYNRFNGTLSSAIGQLKALTGITLSVNYFTGTIPASIGNLTHLTYFEIKYNHFRGPLPKTIGFLQNLTSISVSGNNLSRSLPYEIGNLTMLKSLNLDENQFTGSVPASIGNLTYLFQMFLTKNQFFGSLPPALFNPNAKFINTVTIGVNSFTGTLPPEIKNWGKTLQFLSISRNSFHGTLPIQSFQNMSLRSISLNFNFFDGEIASEFLLPNASKLTEVDIGGNQFTGTIPCRVWPILSYYLAYQNYFSSTVPSDFFKSRRLYYLEISHNYLTGRVPPWVSKSILLTYLNLTENLLTGPLNYTFSKLTHETHLQQISLAYNKLSGTIPRSLGRALTLVDIILNDNEITGSLPESFRDLRNMEVLFLQNNRLTGNLYDFRVYKLINFDCSNNQITGTLPDFTNIAPSLKTFGASSNCIDGTIPENICTVPSITFLALDGLSTATGCRTKFFPRSPIFDGFYVNSYIQKGIPECLFTMPNLQTLHLSGNGLTGSLPSSLNLSESLTDLSLSHNQLTGTIPLYIQERQWSNLDLSYNKFGGTLSGDFHSYDDLSSLTLNINRLSGDIPNVLKTAQNINILEGNLFTCNSDRSALPQHDKNVNTYSCGSDIVNATIYLWLAVLFIFLIMLNALLQGAARITARVRQLQRNASADRDRPISTNSNTSDAAIPMIDEIIQKLVLWRKTIAEFEDPDENVQIAVHSIRIFLRPLRYYAVRLTVFILIVLTPIYLALTVQYRSYFYSYAWSISAVYVSGTISAITMFVPLFLAIMLAIYFYRTMVENPSLVVNEAYRTSRRFRRFLQSVKKLRTEDRAVTAIVLGIVGVMNFLLMLFVDVVYVYIILTYPTGIVILTEACLAVFKLWFNNLVLWKVIPWGKKQLKECLSPDEKENQTGGDASRSPDQHMQSFEVSNLSNYSIHNPLAPDRVEPPLTEVAPALDSTSRPVSVDLSRLSSSSSSMASRSTTLSAVLPSYHVKKTKKLHTYSYSLVELIFIMVTIIFNNVLLPILAIFIVNPDCFYNSLFAASTQTVTYTYVVCDRYSNLANICITDVVLTEQSSYVPPFIYGYECASNVLTNYIPVFIIMYTFEGFLHPLLKIMLKLSSDRLFYQEYFHNEHQHQHPMQFNGLSEIERGSGEEEKGDEKDTKKSISNSRRLSFRQILTKSSSFYRFVVALIPPNLQDLSPYPPKDGPPILFDKNRLAVKINSALVVLISFGALFPPLAVVICISLITLTLFEEFVIGRLLYESRVLGYVWYKKQIERDCYGIAKTLKYTLWSLVPVSSLFFAYIIFDTWGDEEGWLSALPATIVMAFSPILVLVFVKYYDAIIEKLSSYNRKKEEGDDVPRASEDVISEDEVGMGAKSIALRPLPPTPRSTKSMLEEEDNYNHDDLKKSTSSEDNHQHIEDNSLEVDP